MIDDVWAFAGWCRLWLAGPAALIVLAGPAGAVEPPDFNREVRPILSHHCFKCHGPDESARKAKMRLDVRTGVVRSEPAVGDPIVPGHPEQSELVQRINTDDVDDLMPPPAVKKPLSNRQKEILQRWIAGGAKYESHWAFVKPRQAPLPVVHQDRWVRNPIDAFVLARLEQAGLSPSPPADPWTLVRRVYLDLMGLPPTPAEAEAFVRNASDAAYEQLVHRLLASPHYGERWARPWLDLARYADTNGYEKDRPRSIWPWRDWVIRALNADLPFDRFTIEQIAGDMLPHATPEQIIATGFHRNTMLNEEGGIDPLEYRFHAMTDRLATTGTAWLGLTIKCAQCHTHKFDPIPQREYYQMLAFLNNADEPQYAIPSPERRRRQAALDKKIVARIRALPAQYPVENLRWETPLSSHLDPGTKETVERLPDGSWRLPDRSPDQADYTITLETALTNVIALQLEVWPDDQLPRRGPGRSDSGNFVLNRIALRAAPLTGAGEARAVKFAGASADFSQQHFDVQGAIDDVPKTGWAIANPGNKADVRRAAVFTLAPPVMFASGARLTVRLAQHYGQRHTIGRLRMRLGQPLATGAPLETRRRAALEKDFADWLKRESAKAVQWAVLRPVAAQANLPLLTVLDDDSVLASGDQTKSDTYVLKYRTPLTNITALRVEALPDDRLPRRGPGRAYYEGPAGDFNLSNLSGKAGGRPLKFVNATHSFAANNFPARNAIDDNLQTGWAINGGQGRAHRAVFNLDRPLPEARDLEIQMLFARHFSAGLGRFRVAVTTHPGTVVASALSPDIQQLLLVPAKQRTPPQREKLFQAFLMRTPKLTEARRAIDRLRQERDSAAITTLVFRERPPENPRPTFVHHRGEFLQPAERVEPAVLSVLNPLPPDAPRNRLGFARWLVSPDNPLTARVTVNRQWAAFFGRGIVRTVGDFGYQGDPPSHPKLLDWLAVEFMRQGWSLKRLHQLIVMSATYRQSSRVTPERLETDPDNVLLSRGPRVRLEAEMIRDSLLVAAGVLATNLGGPSVFPPQPANITTEGAYGPLAWKVSKGPDRYRRGLYTFAKRTTPYAMFSTFDGPSGEECIAQREESNTPLQALTMLNDVVVIEAAQALGRKLAVAPGEVEARLVLLFRHCLTRPPDAHELSLLTEFYAQQRRHFSRQRDAARALAGDGAGDVAERAVWTALARALFNLDETITKG